MQPLENLLLGLQGNSTQGFYLKNLYCLECDIITVKGNRYYTMLDLYYDMNKADPGMRVELNIWSSGHLQNFSQAQLTGTRAWQTFESVTYVRTG